MYERIKLSLWNRTPLKNHLKQDVPHAICEQRRLEII